MLNEINRNGILIFNSTHRTIGDFNLSTLVLSRREISFNGYSMCLIYLPLRRYSNIINSLIYIVWRLCLVIYTAVKSSAR